MPKQNVEIEKTSTSKLKSKITQKNETNNAESTNGESRIVTTAKFVPNSDFNLKGMSLFPKFSENFSTCEAKKKWIKQAWTNSDIDRSMRIFNRLFVLLLAFIDRGFSSV